MADVAFLARVVVVAADGTHRVLLLLGAGAPGLAAVGELARLQLRARRGGGSIHVQEVSPALAELLDLAGLSRELCGPGGLGREPGGLGREPGGLGREPGG